MAGSKLDFDRQKNLALQPDVPMSFAPDAGSMDSQTNSAVSLDYAPQILRTLDEIR